ncbi:MAG: MATE family efflux transporter [Ruminococcaceae bacterium]|nr:MATE family efflux transporter [Oscillospiraceae bacterium]
MSTAVKDMTTGRPLKLILGMALPLMLGNVFQQLYNIADASIVGRGIGVDAFAAVGVCTWFGYLFQCIVQGLAEGFAIPAAQSFGAKNMPALRKYVANSAVLTIILGVGTALAALILIRPVLTLMRTPEDIFEMAATYLTITALGLPVVMFYNYLAGTLRALGNSKSPLNAMLLSSAVNIVLDLILVIGLGFGIACAAATTVAAQICSCIYCIICLKKVDTLHMERGDFRLAKERCKELLRIGLPMSMQNAAIALGGMVVQGVINPLGVTLIAGYTAAMKLMGIIEMAGYSYGYAMTTFNGQNLGAKNTDRIRSGIRTGLIVGLVTSLIVAAFILLFGRLILTAFIEPSAENAAEVLDLGCEFLRLMSFFFPVLYLIHILRPAVQGLGNTAIPLASCAAELVLRIASAVLLTPIIGYSGVFWTEILAWAAADVVLIPGCIVVFRNTVRRLESEGKNE